MQVHPVTVQISDVRKKTHAGRQGLTGRGNAPTGFCHAGQRGVE